jgi:hypothetical protein
VSDWADKIAATFPLEPKSSQIAAALRAERKRCAEVARKEGEGFRDHNLPQAAMGAFQAAKSIEAGQ